MHKRGDVLRIEFLITWVNGSDPTWIEQWITYFDEPKLQWVDCLLSILPKKLRFEI